MTTTQPTFTIRTRHLGDFFSRNRIHYAYSTEGDLRTVVDNQGDPVIGSFGFVRAKSAKAALRGTHAANWGADIVVEGMVRVESASGLPEEYSEYPVWVAL